MQVDISKMTEHERDYVANRLVFVDTMIGLDGDNQPITKRKYGITYWPVNVSNAWFGNLCVRIIQSSDSPSIGVISLASEGWQLFPLPEGPEASLKPTATVVGLNGKEVIPGANKQQMLDHFAAGYDSYVKHWKGSEPIFSMYSFVGEKFSANCGWIHTTLGQSYDREDQRIRAAVSAATLCLRMEEERRYRGG